MADYSAVKQNESFRGKKGQDDTDSEKKEGCNICSKEWLKTFLIFFTLIIWLTGAALMGVGIYLLFTRYAFLATLAGEVYYVANYIVIIAGALIFIAGILGMVAICKTMRVLLKVYAGLLVAIFVIEVVGGIFAYAFYGQMQVSLARSLNETMTTGYDKNKKIETAVDDMQKAWKCCGSMGYRDWLGSPYATKNAHKNKVPPSCCKTISDTCAQSTHPSNINVVGCVSYCMEKLAGNLILVGAVALGIACVQLLGIITAFCYLRVLPTERAKY